MTQLRVVLGLGFGDEGKGTIVDYLAREGSPPLVIRWNGGPQAAHHVVTNDGRVHCFAQLGSAGFVDGSRTHLGPQMVVDPYALHAEAAAIERVGVPDALARVTIDPRCILVTPWHAILGRVRELLRGDDRHGSTGRGVGEAKLGTFRLTAEHLGQRTFPAEVERVRAALIAQIEEIAAPTPSTAALVERCRDLDLRDAFLAAGDGCGSITPTPPPADHVILEGAQGALLDRDHGFFPHVTPSRITRAAAEAACRELGLAGALEVWGVLRAMHTRHGEGPFPSEDAGLTAALPEPHNRSDEAAGPFRVGWFDAVLARYAVSFAGPIDRLAVTCLDRSPPEASIAVAWNDGAITDLAAITMAERTSAALTARPVLVPAASISAAIESIVGRHIEVASWGPRANDKRQ